MNREQLTDILSKICTYAQDHTRDEGAWGPRNTRDLRNWMQHTSYTVACFISQNTPKGSSGVEWDVVQEELVGPVMREDAWKEIIAHKISFYYD